MKSNIKIYLQPFFNMLAVLSMLTGIASFYYTIHQDHQRQLHNAQLQKKIHKLLFRENTQDVNSFITMVTQIQSLHDLQLYSGLISVEFNGIYNSTYCLDDNFEGICNNTKQKLDIFLNSTDDTLLENKQELIKSLNDFKQMISN